jgi:hypothetical protein
MPAMLRTLNAFAAALLIVSQAAAQPKTKTPNAGAKAAAPKVNPADLSRWRRVLESGNEAELVSALNEMGALGKDGAPAAPLVDTLLQRGAGMNLLIVALETEGRLAVAASSPAVAPYVSHRRAEIRRAAAAALALTGGPVATATLRRALAGADPSVRAIAASGLGQLGAKDSVNDLFAVLGHDTPEAAVAIAALCSPEQCDRLMALVGKLKFEVLEASFVPLLFRPDTELPEENKLAYIDKLRRLATKPAASVLETVLAKLPKDENPKLRVALQAALKARPVVGDSK